MRFPPADLEHREVARLQADVDVADTFRDADGHVTVREPSR